jgi:hypothetical protein
MLSIRRLETQVHCHNELQFISQFGALSSCAGADRHNIESYSSPTSAACNWKKVAYFWCVHFIFGMKHGDALTPLVFNFSSEYTVIKSR